MPVTAPDSYFAPTATKIKLANPIHCSVIAVYNDGLRPCPADTDLSTAKRTLKDLDLLFIGSNSDLDNSPETGTAPVSTADTHDVATT